MSELHTSYTLHSQSSFQHELSLKYDQLTTLLTTGKPGPDLFSLFSKVKPRTVTLAIPPTLLKVSEAAPVALFTNSGGKIDVLAKKK